MVPLQRSESIESTMSEREFRKKYQAITHRMVHRKSSAVMYSRILERTFGRIASMCCLASNPPPSWPLFQNAIKPCEFFEYAANLDSGFTDHGQWSFRPSSPTLRLRRAASRSETSSSPSTGSTSSTCLTPRSSKLLKLVRKSLLKNQIFLTRPFFS